MWSCQRGSTTVMPSRPFEPYHAQIKTDMLRRIRSGEWPVGYKLPNTVGLQAMYRDLIGARSNVHVRRAIDELTEEGILRSHRGAGVWVASLPPT